MQKVCCIQTWKLCPTTIPPHHLLSKPLYVITTAWGCGFHETNEIPALMSQATVQSHRRSASLKKKKVDRSLPLPFLFVSPHQKWAHVIKSSGVIIPPNKTKAKWQGKNSVVPEAIFSPPRREAERAFLFSFILWRWQPSEAPTWFSWKLGRLILVGVTAAFPKALESLQSQKPS